MNRRDLLRAGIATTAATTLSAGMSLVDQGKDSLADKKDAISKKMASFEERFDSLENRHKQLVRAGAAAFAISTGIDVLAFF